jgi:anti-sigma factor RsiW
MDGELTTEQLADVNRHLNRCSVCRQEVEDLREACDPLRRVTFSEPTDEQLERLWRTPFSRLARRTGLAMVLVGWLVLLGYAAVEIARDRAAELPLKLALAGIVVGFLILFVQVLAERLIAHRHDPYKEVER